MAYSKFRFTENAAGMTGRAGMALYDGRGNAGDRTNPPQNPDEGGDELADIKANNFFTGQEVRDAVREASKGQTTGAGLPILLMGTDATEIDTVYLHTSGQLRVRGSGFNVT